MLERHCADVGRDPAQIEHSANALLVLSDDPAEVERATSGAAGPRTIAGNVGQVQEQMQAYVDAGVDEFIIPDFNMRGLEAKKETYDRFMEEVAPAFR